MKKNFYLGVLLSLLPLSINAYSYKNECIGYYQIQLPDNLEVALYPVNLILNPRRNFSWAKNSTARRYFIPDISFGNSEYQNDTDSVQAQFSTFNYDDYILRISSQNHSKIDLLNYERQYKKQIEEHVQDYWNKRNYEISMKFPVLSKDIAEESLRYKINNYPDSFLAASSGSYSLFISKNNRIYSFHKRKDMVSVEEQLKTSEPEIHSLLQRFKPRDLYEMPTGQGFCIPYGFIANDSGHEPRNMAVTYRLKDHPEVSIFIQDLGGTTGPGERRPDLTKSAKEYVTYFWNIRYGHSFREMKLHGKGYSYPKIDGRDGVAAFTKFTRRNKTVDYGYMAYLKAESDDNPGLIFYLIRDSRQAKNNPPMDIKELEKMAEHIVSTIKRR